MNDKAKELGNEIVSPCILRQTSETDFRIATDRDLKENIYLRSNNGLTKREYFAGLAMQGLCVNDGFPTNEKLACAAVVIADALLEELSKTE